MEVIPLFGWEGQSRSNTLCSHFMIWRSRKQILIVEAHHFYIFTKSSWIVYEFHRNVVRNNWHNTHCSRGDTYINPLYCIGCSSWFNRCRGCTHMVQVCDPVTTLHMLYLNSHQYNVELFIVIWLSLTAVDSTSPTYLLPNLW